MKISIDTLRKTKGIGRKTLERVIEQHNIDKDNYIPARDTSNNIAEGIFLGDSYKLIQSIPDGYVDLVLIDPPYEISHHGGKESNYFYKNPNSTKNQIKGFQEGFNLRILEDFIRIQEKTNIVTFCSNKQVSRLMQWGEDRGKIVNLLVWHKPDAPPFNNGVYISDLEYIVHIRDYGSTFKKGHSRVMRHNIVRNGNHIAEKPLSILQKFIKNNTNEGDVVLDCFMGSGSTGVACKNLNRKFIGIELDKEYFEIAKERINKVK